MARANYLISGLPGTGKTSVCEELQLRGYHAIDADKAFGFQADNGWIWNDEKLSEVLDDLSSDTLFICGSASNRDKYMDRFAKIFILYVDSETLKTRLIDRTNNNFGKSPATLTRQLELNEGVKEYSIKRGRIIIDATQSITEVVGNILDKIKVKKD
jgi:dephospho-CoA kinase